MVDGRWSVVDGQWSVVGGRWSVVGGRWSMVGGRWSVVGGRGRWSPVFGRSLVQSVDVLLDRSSQADLIDDVRRFFRRETGRQKLSLVKLRRSHD